MSTIKDFMIPLDKLEAVREKVYIEKFGKTPFIVKSITEEENVLLRKRATKTEVNRQGQKTSDFKYDVYVANLVIACLEQPDPKNAELQSYYGTTGSANDTLRKMLNPGEYARLLEAVHRVNGFDESIDDKKDEVKED